MPSYRNASADVMVDALTGLVAGPDEVIDVADDLAEHYEDHAVWAPVASLGARPMLPTPPADTADSKEA